jgi:hypothetical protein
MKHKKILIAVLVLLTMTAGLAWLSRRPADFSSDIKWGVAFSRMWAVQLGLDPRETYLAILHDLRPREVRLPVYWHDIEAVEGKYDFTDYDWMVREAEQSGTPLVLVVGGKLPRWPECHDPDWVKENSREERENKLLAVVSLIVGRYKDSPALSFWQVENEPFLPFGADCPTVNKDFLQREINLVHSLDNKHQIITTDGGEFGLWAHAAYYGDVFGTTMYLIVWNKYLGYWHYNLPPRFFWLKQNLLHILYPDKKIIISELQGEPWSHLMIYETTIEEQYKSMNLAQFRDNINYAKAVGIEVADLWGAEWWYWMKTKHNEPAFWNEIKLLMSK